MMATFKIHEDKENRYVDKRNILQKLNNKRNPEEKKNNRQILGTVTDIQRNGVAKNLKPIRNEVAETKENIQRVSKANSCLLEKDLFCIPNVEDYQILREDIVTETTQVVENINENQYHKRLDIYSKYIYRLDIKKYLLESEKKHRPNYEYMKKQPELNDGMRGILVDWFISISDEYDFAPETLHLAVFYLDRFLSKMSVIRGKLQLVGVAALMIAAKYEEIYPPDSAEFASLTKDTFNIKQILKMEQLMLRTLSFDLTVPTIQTFIEEYSSQSETSKESICLAMYISELWLVESAMNTRYLPSTVAAACLLLADHILNADTSAIHLDWVYGHSTKKILPIVKQQYKLLKDAPTKTLQAVQMKYNKDSLCCITDLLSKYLQNAT